MFDGVVALNRQVSMPYRWHTVARMKKQKMNTFYSLVTRLSLNKRILHHEA
ncbi:hypothetical protein BFV94_3112 [Alteromonas macleodii]|uniref:Uncharacterized protein n=1 Tax=Alteromonas macleodii TaxID=28108 RepID=A0AB36FSI1_ALTMA|nr:hypothetical protein BFV93_3100 [Alteromonas macleodii]OES30041.1 hypothetical protein BFV94_3112 [Alteromonas macleodii]OES30567.1 hypothetical protein BFV95_3112 [Alteromonas macleodii]OES40687.1 hypothetical protein BFV96_3094 [Alteromonas macleodii]